MVTRWRQSNQRGVAGWISVSLCSEFGAYVAGEKPVSRPHEEGRLGGGQTRTAAKPGIGKAIVESGELAKILGWGLVDEAAGLQDTVRDGIPQWAFTAQRRPCTSWGILDRGFGEGFWGSEGVGRLRCLAKGGGGGEGDSCLVTRKKSPRSQGERKRRERYFSYSGPLFFNLFFFSANRH